MVIEEFYPIMAARTTLEHSSRLLSELELTTCRHSEAARLAGEGQRHYAVVDGYGDSYALAL